MGTKYYDWASNETVTAARLNLPFDASGNLTLDSATSLKTVGAAATPIKSVTLDNTATDGGAIYFDAGTTKFIKSSADGATLTVGGFTSFISTGTINLVTVGRGGGAVETNLSVGNSSLNANISGAYNTAIGYHTLLSNLTGVSNTFVGTEAGLNQTSGSTNTGIGVNALYSNETGSNNTAIGVNALDGQTSGNNNTGIGRSAEVPNLTGSNQVRIGNTDVSYAGIQVAWTITSDAKYKTDIKENKFGLDFILKLKPVDYERISSGKREIGFIAQDIKAILPENSDEGFLSYNESADCLELRYNDFIPMLVTAIQEQQKQIEELKNLINK